MTYTVDYCGSFGDAERYLIQLGRDRVEAIVGNENSCLRINGEVLDEDLTTLVAEEMRELVSRDRNGILLQRTNEILNSLGFNPIEGSYPLDKESYWDLRELKNAFNEWSGRPTPRQRRILVKLGLEYVNGGTHSRIRKIADPERFVPVSSTPSDVRTGKNLCRGIIRHLL